MIPQGIIQPHYYFLNQYGKKRGVTVMHRMRTWYNTQARLADRQHDEVEAQRMSAYADAMTANIEAAKGVR